MFAKFAPYSEPKNTAFTPEMLHQVLLNHFSGFGLSKTLTVSCFCLNTTTSCSMSALCRTTSFFNFGSFMFNFRFFPIFGFITSLGLRHYWIHGSLQKHDCPERIVITHITLTYHVIRSLINKTIICFNSVEHAICESEYLLIFVTLSKIISSKH